MRHAVVIGSLLLLTPLAACGSSSSAAPSPAAAAATPSSSSASVAGSAGDAPSSPSDAGAPAATSTSTLDPCALLTKADVVKVLGGTSSAAKAVKDSAQGPLCDFDVTGGSPKSVASVDDFISSMTPDQYHQAKTGLLSAPGAAVVPGVGDDAFYQPSGDAVIYLKGQHVVTVQAVEMGKPDPGVEAKVIELAKIAASRS